MSVGVLLPEKIKSSRSMRRVAWTVSSLTVLLLIGAIVAWRIHKENEPEEYAPGEKGHWMGRHLDVDSIRCRHKTLC